MKSILMKLKNMWIVVIYIIRLFFKELFKFNKIGFHRHTIIITIVIIKYYTDLLYIVFFLY
jgi:hypothetical protein